MVKIVVVCIKIMKSEILLIYSNIKNTNMDTHTKFHDCNDDNKENTTKKHEKNDDDSNEDLNCTYSAFSKNNNIRRSEGLYNNTNTTTTNTYVEELKENEMSKKKRKQQQRNSGNGFSHLILFKYFLLHM